MLLVQLLILTLHPNGVLQTRPVAPQGEAVGPNSTAVRRSREFAAGIFFVHLNYVVGH